MLLILARFLSVWAGTPFPIDLVSSNSMEPTLYEGDIIAWTPTRIQDIEEGDVIVFKSNINWPDEKILVHRVTDIITTSSGKIYLETKGDNNEYVDQAGPHIPEPYISEDNLMGKTLSIGKVPLKVPFIGYIGVWINDGLSSISEPSSSKESVSYVGIFAPVTISIVILVILMFILPEKARTVKEKLHLNIFGRQPLNLKKTILLFLTAYVIFLFVIHCFAYESIETSVGVGASSPEIGYDFARIGSGEESLPKELPLINPGTMPVKGIIFCKGDMSEFIDPQIFQLEAGAEKVTIVKAVSKPGQASGGYTGELMMYSSPFWLIFPDDFLMSLNEWNGQLAVYILDLISSLILTGITFFILTSVTYVGDKTIEFMIDRSWYHPSRLFLKRETAKRAHMVKNEFIAWSKSGIDWLLNVDLSILTKKEHFMEYAKKPIIASIIIIPIFFILKEEILAIFISVLIAAVLAYLISCKIRNKIVLTVIIAMSIGIIHMAIESNLAIVSKTNNMLEIMALSTGTIGVYLLLLSIFLIPLAFLSWLITRYIRNLKEQKDPLLSLERTCDL